MKSINVLAKHIFLDIVKYSYQRTIEAQSDIIESLNRIVKIAVIENMRDNGKTIYLPTGDGICISIVNQIDPYDLHIRIALTILKELSIYNSSQIDEKRKYSIRIGINENYDNVITDINNNENIAGAGINMAQRIMNMADDNQIFVGSSVYEKLEQREDYTGHFFCVEEEIKHNIHLTAYRFINDKIAYLNSTYNDDSTKEKEVPGFISLYCTILKYFEMEIAELDSVGPMHYAIKIVLMLIAEDIINYAQLDDIEKRKWGSRIIDTEYSNLATASRKIYKNKYWVLRNACEYNMENYNIYEWNILFKNNYLFLSDDGNKHFENKCMQINSDVSNYIKNMYPQFREK
jgi:hypothetical protein